MAIEIKNWVPMSPLAGPPLPLWMQLYWPWYTPPAAEFKVSDLVISPVEIEIGQLVTISCLVANIGAEAGDYTLKMGGDFVAEQTVTLQPSESKTVSFEVTPTEPKDYNVSVNGLTGTFKAVEVPVADIRVEDLNISPSEVYVGEKVTITCRATNYGNKVGTRVIKCEVV